MGVEDEKKPKGAKQMKPKEKTKSYFRKHYDGNEYQHLSMLIDDTIDIAIEDN